MRKEKNIDRVIEESVYVADINKKAEIARKLMSDKRHADFVSFIIDIIAIKREMYDNLGDATTSNDEYLRRSLILSTEIKTLKWITAVPHMFIKAETKIKEVSK